MASASNRGARSSTSGREPERSRWRRRRSCARVVAVDVSAQMLAVIEAKAARLGVGNLECVRAGFLSYEHTGSPADFVYSRHALHHLPDFWKAIAVERIASMLHPGRPAPVAGSRVRVRSEGGASTHRCVARRRRRAQRRRLDASELQEHLCNEHSTFSWLLEPMIERAGFVIERASFDELGVRGAYVCRRR